MRRSVVALGAALLCPSAEVWATEAEPPVENPLVFVVDRRLGMEAGVRTVHSLGRVAFYYDDALADALDIDETRPEGKAVAIGGRLAKGLFLDAPLVFLQTTFVHEVFGHGARARELGLSPTYTFRLVPPYRRPLSPPDPDDPDAPDDDSDASVATTLYEPSGVLDEDLAVRLAGIEADYASAWWLQVGMVQRGGWMHFRDLLQYGVFRLDYVGSLASNQGEAPDDPATSNDVKSYVNGLQLRYNRWRPEDRQAIARNLQVGYLVGLADPMLWLSAYHGVVTYGLRGHRHARLPMIQAGEWSLLPAMRYGLTPYGPEHGLDLFAKHRDVVYDIYVRAGTSGLAPSAGAGVRAFGLPVGHGRQLGGELDLWWQPDLMFDRLHVFERRQQLGAQLGLHIDWPVYRQLGLAGKLGYKSEGYVLAQPLGAGPVGYLGLSITPGEANARE